MVKNKKISQKGTKKASLVGLEPTTFELEVQCANHYATGTWLDGPVHWGLFHQTPTTSDWMKSYLHSGWTVSKCVIYNVTGYSQRKVCHASRKSSPSWSLRGKVTRLVHPLLLICVTFSCTFGWKFVLKSGTFAALNLSSAPFRAGGWPVLPDAAVRALGQRPLPQTHLQRRHWQDRETCHKERIQGMYI